MSMDQAMEVTLLRLASSITQEALLIVDRGACIKLRTLKYISINNGKLYALN